MYSDIGLDTNNNFNDAQWSWVELTRMPPNPTGARNFDRVGNDITMSSVSLNLMVEDWQPMYIGRLLIVQYPNKVDAPSAADLDLILEYGQPDGSATPPVLESHVIQSPYRVGSTQKFRILRDVKICLPTGIKSSLLQYKFHLTPKGKKGFSPILSFEADDPSSESAYKNNIFAYWRFTDHNTNIGPAIKLDCTFTHRMTYRDA